VGSKLDWFYLTQDESDASGCQDTLKWGVYRVHMLPVSHVLSVSFLFFMNAAPTNVSLEEMRKSNLQQFIWQQRMKMV
jgi:hypothetical protein